MPTLTLILTTPSKDEIGRLELDGVAIAEAGTMLDAGGPPGRQMQELYGKITKAVERESLKPALEPLDLHILVSRTLLQRPSAEGAIITLPVLPLAGDTLLVPSEGSAAQDDTGLDDLLDLTDLDKGESQ
jgi:hypothetical protein